MTAAVLSACGSDGSDGRQVASLSTATSGVPSTSVPSASATDGSSRPQIRLDTSAKEKDRLRKSYYACLAEHGHRMYPGRGSPVQDNLTSQDEAAKKECLGKKPLRPPQLDREKNPQYLDDYHSYIECLHDNGMDVRPTKPFGTGWTYGPGGSSQSEDQKMKIDQKCKISAFGDG
ncbi:hypothetical protein [Saccharomonospora halophila]|uniref:hypothetical protein n=1 Tax=Saccharomonospora halophila TaxID=129922 RepID=UPI0012F8DEF6|nr:hypothetical protein [Saccharomonospora halophila]